MKSMLLAAVCVLAFASLAQAASIAPRVECKGGTLPNVLSFEAQIIISGTEEDESGMYVVRIDETKQVNSVLTGFNNQVIATLDRATLVRDGAGSLDLELTGATIKFPEGYIFQAYFEAVGTVKGQRPVKMDCQSHLIYL